MKLPAELETPPIDYGCLRKLEEDLRGIAMKSAIVLVEAGNGVACSIGEATN